MKIRMYSIGYFLKLAFQGVFRNGLMSFASVVVLISSLLVTGGAWVLRENADYNLRDLSNYNKIVVFVSKNADSVTTDLLREKIQSIDNIESIEYRSKDEVLESLLMEYGDYEEVLEMYGDDNPCKDEIIITYADASKVDTIVYRLENMNEDADTKGSIAKINDRRDVAKKIDNIKNMSSVVLTWIMVLLCALSVFIIINTVKLAVSSRSDEISIMRYVGASKFFVGAPFILEGIIIGLFSSGVAFALQYYIYERFVSGVIGESELVSIIPFSEMLPFLTVAFAAIGIGLGMIGSFISLRKYNKA